jgi:hypothetical protein
VRQVVAVGFNPIILHDEGQEPAGAQRERVLDGGMVLGAEGAAGHLRDLLHGHRRIVVMPTVVEHLGHLVEPAGM